MKRDVIGGYVIGRCIGGNVSQEISLNGDDMMKLPGFCDTYCDRNDTCSNNGECDESGSQQKAKCPLCAVSIVWFFDRSGVPLALQSKSTIFGG